jgi:hypothetical protein
MVGEIIIFILVCANVVFLAKCAYEIGLKESGGGHDPFCLRWGIPDKDCSECKRIRALRFKW